MLRNALLDIDGTLIDSNDQHAQAWIKALEENGLSADFQIIRSSIGMGGDHILPGLFGIDEESEIGKRISKRRGEIFRDQFLPKLQIFPGTISFLSRLREVGFQLIVATSASKEDSHALLDKFHLTKWMDVITSSDDAEKSKPDPDIVLAALNRGSARANQSVMFGDTPYDVLAARRAGVPLFGFRCGGWSSEDLYAAGARAVFAGPAEARNCLSLVTGCQQL